MNNSKYVFLFLSVALCIIFAVYLMIFLISDSQEVNLNYDFDLNLNINSQITKSIFVYGAVLEEKEYIIPVNFTYAHLINLLKNENNFTEFSVYNSIEYNKIIPDITDFIVINYYGFSPVNIVFASLENYRQLGIKDEIAYKIFNYAHHNFSISSKLELLNILTEEEFNQIKFLTYSYVPEVAYENN